MDKSRNKFSGHRKWLSLLTLLVVTALQVCIVSDHKMDEELRKHPEFKEGMGMLQTSPRATQLLGGAISAGSPINENSEVVGDTGYAKINVPVKGNKASGFLGFVETKKAGHWSIDHMEVRLNGQTTWQVLIPAK